jgi:DNA-binding transcriptional MerR regulator
MKEYEKLLTIQQVSLSLKIPRPTLRYWEREFAGILVPLRTAGGQRRYAVEHITLLERIKKLKQDGMSLAMIKRELRHGNREKSNESENVVSLADRIAAVVREEIQRYFEGEERQRAIIDDRYLDRS